VTGVPEAAAPGTWRAPAKVNLWLAVTGRRADGYHTVDAGYQAIDLADSVVLEPGERDGVACRVEGEWAPGVPEGEDNLAARAARALAEAAGQHLRLAINIAKRVPPAAGLGGGSSDAAAVLAALARRFGVSPDALPPIAARLGADVPFFLQGGTRRARGIGELLELVETPAERWGILLHPGVGVSTAWAYRAWDESGATPAGEIADDWRERGNAFEGLVFARHPEVRRAAEILAGGPASLVRMSGSGSAVFALYAGEAARDRDLARIEEAARVLPGARTWRFAFEPRGVAPAERDILKDSRAAGG